MITDLNKILSVLKVIECGGFSRAAKAMEVPKSKLSRHVADVEESMGVRLIDRSNRTFSPTSAGRALYERGLAPANEIVDLVDEFRDEDEKFSGTVRIATHEDVGQLVLGPVIAEFQRRYPKVNFDVVLTHDFITLTESDLDFVIKIGTPIFPDFKRIRVGSINLILTASPAFAQHHRLMHINQLEELPTLSFFKFKSLWDLRDKTSISKVRINPSIQSNNPRFLASYCEAGGGVALLPRFMCARALQEGTLVQVFKGWSKEEEPIAILISPLIGRHSFKSKFRRLLEDRLRPIFGAS